MATSNSPVTGMQPITEAQLLQLYDQAESLHAIDKAIAIIACAYPDLSQPAITQLPIGMRDACLLNIRLQTFGHRIVSVLGCPECDEQAEIELDIRDLMLTQVSFDVPRQYQFNSGRYRINYRLPNSLDMSVVARQTDAASIRTTLLARCIDQVNHQTGGADAADSSPTAAALDLLDQVEQEALIQDMAQHDPQAEIKLATQCPACQAKLSHLFDIVSFLWDEIASHARVFLWQVHALARSYGWTEAEVLSMSAVRRRRYLDLLL